MAEHSTISRVLDVVVLFPWSLPVCLCYGNWLEHTRHNVGRRRCQQLWPEWPQSSLVINRLVARVQQPRIGGTLCGVVRRVNGHGGWQTEHIQMHERTCHTRGSRSRSASSTCAYWPSPSDRLDTRTPAVKVTHADASASSAVGAWARAMPLCSFVCFRRSRTEFSCVNVNSKFKIQKRTSEDQTKAPRRDDGKDNRLRYHS